MSTTNLNSAGCGCQSTTPVLPENLAMVPPGSMIVQTPCAEGCSPQSSANLSAVQAAAAAANAECAGFANPCLKQGFIVPALNKTGTLVAVCASTWALPGMRLYFSGLGYLEVLGSSGDVITFVNLNMEPGTEVSSGLCFGYGIPHFLVQTDDEGTVPELDSSSTLDEIWGMDGNVQKRILPQDGMLIYGCGGKWQRRQAGQFRYPTTRTSLLAFSGAISGTSWVVALPNKPTLPNCSPGLAIGVDGWIGVNTTTSLNAPQVFVTVAGVNVFGCYGYPNAGNQANGMVVDLPSKSDTTVTIATSVGGSIGTMNINLWINSYWY